MTCPQTMLKQTSCYFLWELSKERHLKMFIAKVWLYDFVFICITYCPEKVAFVLCWDKLSAVLWNILSWLQILCTQKCSACSTCFVMITCLIRIILVGSEMGKTHSFWRRLSPVFRAWCRLSILPLGRPNIMLSVLTIVKRTWHQHASFLIDRLTNKDCIKSQEIICDCKKVLKWTDSIPLILIQFHSL